MKKILFIFLFLRILKATESDSLQTPELTHEKSINTLKSFNIPQYLEEIKNLGCFSENHHEKFLQNKTIKNTCVRKIEENLFKKLTPGYGHIELWNLFNKNLYKPLAYNISRKSNILEILEDLFFLTKDKNLISNKDMDKSYDMFENKVLQDFRFIEENGTDDDQIVASNKSFVEILKDFHIYWNSLRDNDQILKARTDTMKIMDNLLTQYSVKEKFVFEITKTLVKKIKEAYGRFMEAHQSLDRIKQNGPEIISHLILVRYTSFLEKIKMAQSNYIDFVHEIAFLMDLTQSYFISLQKQNIKEEESLVNFEKDIYSKITEKYQHFTQNLINNDNLNALKNIKHFTVTVLLKLKHLNFIIFKYKSLYEIININKTETPVQKKLSVKIYYEILDNYLSLPKKCEEFSNLKNCINFQSKKILKYITSKYMLQRSVSGWTLYEYLQNLFNNIIENQEEKNWQSMKKFKKQFYKSIFSSLFAYKKKYFIKDTKSLDELENKIGKIIDNFKNNSDPENVSFELIDQLDMDIYDEFLEIKSLFDDYVPFAENVSILDKVQELLFKFVDNFHSEFNEKVNRKFIQLLDLIKKSVGKWKSGFLENEENTKGVDLTAIDNNPDIFLKNNQNNSGEEDDQKENQDIKLPKQEQNSNSNQENDKNSKFFSLYNKKIRDDNEILDELMEIPDNKDDNFYVKYKGRQGPFASGEPSNLVEAYPKEEIQNVKTNDLKISDVHFVQPSTSNYDVATKKDKKQI